MGIKQCKERRVTEMRGGGRGKHVVDRRREESGVIYSETHQAMMQSCNGSSTRMEAAMSSEWAVGALFFFLRVALTAAGQLVGLRVERLLTRDLLGTRLDARPTCCF
jgi:hypothetical protein